MFEDYQVEILDSNRNLVHVVDDYDYIRWRRKFYKPNSAKIKANRYSSIADHAKNGNFLQVKKKDGTVEYSGVINHREIQLEQSGKISEQWTYYAISPVELRLLLPPSGSSHYTDTNPAETVLKNMVDKSLVNATDTDRNISWLQIETDSGSGSSVDIKARYNPLEEKLEEAALANEDIGYEIVGNAFKTINGVDRSHGQSTNSTIEFSEDMGNIKSLKYENSKLKNDTYFYVGGDGEGTNRIIAEGWLGGNGSGVNRREGFLDARDLTSQLECSVRAVNEARRVGTGEKVRGEIAESQDVLGNFEYRTDWDLGDIVTVAYGTLLSEVLQFEAYLRITEIAVTLEQGKEYVEVQFGQEIGNSNKQREQIDRRTREARNI